MNPGTPHDRLASVDPAPGEASSIALALVNTALHGPSGPTDLLTDVEVAADWLTVSGIASAGLRLDPGDLPRLTRLRTAIRDLLGAAAEARQPSPGHVTVLNRAAAGAPGAAQLVFEQAALSRVWVASAGSSVDIALAALATDAIELATGDRAEQIRSCEAHGCIRMFLREHARRRWCSNTCGDRVRAARHYQRITQPGETT